MKNSEKYLILLLSIFCICTVYKLINIWDESQNKINCIEISAATLFENLNEYIIIDPRPIQDYKNKKIKNALSYPFANRNTWKKTITKEIKLNSKIVVYCDSYLCNLSNFACAFLVKLNYKNVYILKGGITQWDELGYPVSF